jgi:hypothetical protein
MNAYTHPQIDREFFLTELRVHREADRLAHVGYWNGTKGCATGCAVETINRRLGVAHKHNNHNFVADALGWPVEIVQLQDAIFEGLRETESLDWPLRVSSAIKQGADLSGVWPQFAAWLLREFALPACRDNKRCAVAVERVLVGFEIGYWPDNPDNAAKAAAQAANQATTYAADYAAKAAKYAATNKAAHAVIYTCHAIQASNDSNPGIAYSKMADKLVELCEACKFRKES